MKLSILAACLALMISPALAGFEFTKSGPPSPHDPPPTVFFGGGGGGP